MDLKLFAYKECTGEYRYYAYDSFDSFINGLSEELYQERYEEDTINSPQDILKNIFTDPYQSVFEIDDNELVCVFSEDYEDKMLITTKKKMLENAKNGEFLGYSD